MAFRRKTKILTISQELLTEKIDRLHWRRERERTRFSVLF